MKIPSVRWILLALTLGIAFLLAACGGASNNAGDNANNDEPTATRRAVAATSNAGEPTQDPLDDSASGTPAQDPLDDSSDNSGTPGPPTTPDESVFAPQVENGQVVLPGTSWYAAADDRIYQFCDAGRWELIQGGDTVEKSGTFEIAEGALRLQETGAAQPTAYQMEWNAEENILTLSAENSELELQYDGDAICS